jgi:hypothetical protein
MSARHNNVTEIKNELSQLDYSQVIKHVHSYPGQYLRTKDSVTVVSEFYDSFTVEYDGSNRPTEVCYFQSTKPHISTIGFAADVAGSLTGKSFYIYSARNEARFRVYYKVNGSGSVVAEAGTIDIPVDIISNDPSTVVALATEYTLNTYDMSFQNSRVNSVLSITNKQNGITNDTLDVDTGFIFQNTQGERSLAKKVTLTYASGNPVWQGEELKGYYYNVFDAKFYKSPSVDVDISAESGDSIAISGHPNPIVELDAITKLDSELSTSAYTEIFSFTAVEDIKIRTLKVKANTMGEVRLRIDGVDTDFFNVSNFERNCIFTYIEDLPLTIGQVLTIDFVPERIQLATYPFFMRIDGYK